MKSIALVAVSLVFVLQTAPSRADELCSDDLRHQCEVRNAQALWEFSERDARRVLRHCLQRDYDESLDFDTAFDACYELGRLVRETFPPTQPNCYLAAECELDFLR